jgi:energy-coupling factor transporter ATP-binding protein EcfA2
MKIDANVRAPMINRVVIRRFKRFEEQVFDLKPFNLLIGPNNHGKTTLLQALSAWQLAYSTWRAARKVQPGPIGKNLRGVPIPLPNFHSVPLTDFKHLWTGKRTQWFDQKEYGEFQKKRDENGAGKKYQGKYTVEIIVNWKSMGVDQGLSDHHFGMAFLYDNEQSILVKPTPDTEELPHDTDSIVLTHIPPFSGLDAQEEYFADGAIRRRIGLSQPGSVVRNLLWRVFKKGHNWGELKKNVERYLGVQLKDPQFAEDIDPHIICEYIDLRGRSGEPFDLVNGGSGFHQLVTIFAILYWNNGTHLLLDEPDAHLHAWAQSGVLEFLKDMTRAGKAQIVIATHSLAMLDRCKPEEVCSLMKETPAWLVEDKEKFSVRSGLDTVETSVLTFLQEFPFVLYVEGTSDIQTLRLLARALGKDETVFDKIPTHILGGRDPKEAREHFLGVKSFRQDTQAVCVLDPDLDPEGLGKCP